MQHYYNFICMLRTKMSLLVVRDSFKINVYHYFPKYIPLNLVDINNNDRER